MSAPRDYEDIPGTYVYDAERGRVGYHLNMFCMSLNEPENRKAFKADEAAYLERFPLTPEQKQAVLKRDWLGMLKVGGNIYYTIKIAFCDGLTFQDVAGMMCSMPKEEYAKMMMAGGRIARGQSLQAGWRRNRWRASSGASRARTFRPSVRRSTRATRAIRTGSPTSTASSRRANGWRSSSPTSPSSSTTITPTRCRCS